MNQKAFVLILLGSVFSVKHTKAQYISINGQFEIDQQLGCSDLTVTVTNIDPGSDPSVIQFQFNGPTSAITQNPVHTYTSPGTYWINQFIQGTTGQKKDSISVTVVSPELPVVELFTCNNFEVQVQINDTYYDKYEVDFGDGTVVQVISGASVPAHTYVNGNARNISVTGLFTTATNRCGATTYLFTPTSTVLPAQVDSLVILDNSTFKINYQLPAYSVNKLEVSVNDNANYVLYKSLDQNTSADTLTNLNLSLNSYCFRIATYDACSNFKSYSNEGCSVNLATSTQNNQITLDWNTVTIGGAQATDIVKNNTPLTSQAAAIQQYVDTAVVCNTLYCYKAEVTFPGGAVSYSLKACETAFSTDPPPAIDNISSITNEESIDWSWEVPVGVAPYYFVVHEVGTGGNIISTDTSFVNTYTNTIGSGVQNLAVELYDSCGNSAPIGNIGSNIRLAGNRNSSEEISLSWNNYQGWVDGQQEYMLTIKDNQGNLLDSISVGFSTTYTLPLDQQTEQTMVFAVWAIPVKTSLSYSRSNNLTFERSPIISIPNSFTPNGDGLNDTFLVKGKFIESYEMQVYDRWGEILFYSNDIDVGWDGTRKGKKLPTGNYAYWVRVKDLNNKEHIRTGSILILSN